MRLIDTFRLRSKDPAVRRKAVEHLRGAGDQHSINLLKGALTDADSELRAAAAAALGSCAGHGSAEALATVLRDPVGQVREAAAGSLGQLGALKQVPALTPLLRDPQAGVRTAAAGALRKLGWKPGDAEEQALYEVAIGNTRGAVLSGSAAVAPLVNELNNDTGFVRRAVAEALGTIDDPRKIQPLLAAAADPDPTVRVSVIHALAKVVSEEKTAILLRRMVRDRDAKVRLAAAQVLARRKDPADFPPFVRLLADTDFEVRQTALEHLGSMGDPSLAPHFISMLSDSDSDVRRAAARALGNGGGPEAITPLVIALADEDLGVRQTAEKALESLDPHWVRSAEARSAVPQLEQLAAQRPAWVQAAVKHLISRLTEAPANVVV